MEEKGIEIEEKGRGGGGKEEDEEVSRIRRLMSFLAV